VLLLERAQAFAGRPAVVDPDTSLTYEALIHASGALALDILTITKGTPAQVALLFDQDAAYLCAVLATLRAGCTYVPLDARRGALWNRDAVALADCAAVVCADRYAELAGQLATPVIRAGRRPRAPDDDRVCVVRPADSVACIYFTSGTTGAPKAVCDLHRNLVHNAMRYARSLGTSDADRLSLIQAPIFSGTQSTMFMGLLQGALLCSFDVTQRGLAGLPGWLRERRVTMFHSVPAIFRTLARDGERYPDMRLVRIEGDRATHRDVDVLREHFPPACVLVNGLGATECGLVRQFFVTGETQVASGDLPLGHAVADMQVSIVDDAGRPVAPGSPGEVAVTSHYLAAGYLGRPDLTATKFKTLPDGRRTYLTGDIGRLDPELGLRLAGRRDHQIKVNGITVDLADVEAALVELPGVAHGLMAQRFERSERGLLVAYLVPSGADRPGLQAVRELLSARLPAHLLPAAVVWLAELPLSIDGKVDRAALPAVTGERPDLDQPYVPPASELERTVARIWQLVLALEPIGLHDDLLLLGADSLSIVQAANLIRSGFGVEIDVAAFFDQPTVDALAQSIAARTRTPR
jgi:non-ribosomal peptide synthetase component F/aryl carrier-like protein